MQNLPYRSYLLLIVIYITGCNVNELAFNNIEIKNSSRQVAVPLGTLSYTMREAIEELIEQNEDDEFVVEEHAKTTLLALVYEESASYSGADDLVSIKDIQNRDMIDVIPQVQDPAIGTVTQQFTLTYNPENREDLDSVFYKTGAVSLIINANITYPVSYTFTIDNMTHTSTGKPMSITGNLDDGTDSQTRSLENHKMILNPGETNRFDVNLEASVNIPAGGALIGTEIFTFTLTFTDQTFLVLYGKFGQDHIRLSEIIARLNFFKNTGAEGITFKDPKIRFTFDNSFGLPIGIDFSDLYSKGKVNNTATRTTLTGAITRAPLPLIESPTINEMPGTVKQSVIEINSSNSNVVTLFATSPQKIALNVSALSNPRDVSDVNFIRDDSKVDVKAEMEIPMELQMENSHFSEDINIADKSDFDEVESAFIRVVTINEFPFSVLMDMEILDKNDRILFTVTENRVLNTPFIDVGGVVTELSKTTLDIPIDETGIQALNTGSKLRWRMTLNTPPSLTSRPVFVKFSSNDRLQIKIGVAGKVDIDT